MDEADWSKRNGLLREIAIEISISKYPFGGDGKVILPDGRRVTKDEYWITLTDSDRDDFLTYAHAAYRYMEVYGLQEVMSLSFKEYLSEK